MGRPLGSKNKTKDVPLAISKAAINPSVPTEKVISPVEWKPEPKMNEPTKAETVCACFHKGASHYGGDKGWCNVGGCNCQEFK